jgi:hypothetical protein
MSDQRKFLTTHVGSLPRPPELTQLMFAREDGLPFDASALDEQVARAVELVVKRQLTVGLDIINDGEMPKPSYATYVKDRLTGFGGTGNSYVFQDLEAPQQDARRLHCSLNGGSPAWHDGQAAGNPDANHPTSSIPSSLRSASGVTRTSSAATT